MFLVDEQLARISELKQLIITAGYHPAQLSNIIREVVGNTSFPTTCEKCSELIETLEYYCEFAKKCQKIKL